MFEAILRKVRAEPCHPLPPIRLQKLPKNAKVMEIWSPLSRCGLGFVRSPVQDYWSNAQDLLTVQHDLWNLPSGFRFPRINRPGECFAAGEVIQS